MQALSKVAEDTPTEEVRREVITKARSLLEPKLSSLVTKGLCEDARSLVAPLVALDPKIFSLDVDRCKRDHKLAKAMVSADPRIKYFAAVELEDAGGREEAKKLYRDIISRFSQHALALKASDRLLAIRDQEVKESQDFASKVKEENESMKRDRESSDEQKKKMNSTEK